MIEAYNVMQDRITRARLAGDPADIMISPRVGHIGMFEFHRAEEAIRIGAEAAERVDRDDRRRRSRRWRRRAITPSGCNRAAPRSFALDLVQALLHHVADRDDADETILLDHRDVAEFAARHLLHDDR